uniref:Chorein_N domain-containing protein n=1 Tax=Pristionchus pacificus TaxID=54126 RepID=A0A8R1YDF4_PRIPA
MTSIIKNQIVKHLSKFAKNITPDQISLDVLKGKSELKNIVLNEEVLTEVLELPVWLRIRKATCNRVAVKIQWMKLKSAPIELFIDEIQVDIILTAEKPPPKKKGASLNALSAMDTGSYGFANKVVEGMSLYVNTLEIHFDSGAFGGSFMLSRLSVDSRTPGWQHPHDLRHSRISCPNTNRTIMYKQISWQLLRIEASAHNEGESAQRNVINAPLRLITSNGRIRIALKKNSTDGNVIHARIMMILEDILWVATLPQLQSAIAFYSHIMKLVKASQGFGNIEVLLPARTPSSLAPSNHATETGLAPNKNFAVFDFNQTSYHLNVKKIDLHLCDDAHSPEVYPPQWDIESGAMQVTLHTLLIDVYPKTPAAADRSKWVRYASPNPVTTFLEQNLKHHFARLIENTVDETTRVRLTRIWPQLMSFNVVFRVLDMSVQCVSDMQTKRDSLFNLFESDSEAKRKFPGEQFVLHAEFANFFHPMSDSLPVPPPLTHVQFGPFSLLFDKRTIRWILYVAHHLTVALSQVEAPDMEPLPVTDFKLDLLMPKVILRLPDPSSDSRLPHRLTVSLSTLSISNRSTEEQNHFTLLDTHLMDYLHGLALPSGKDILRSDLLQLNSNMTVSGLEEGDQLWLSSSPMWVETDHGPDTRGLLLITDVPLKASLTIRKDQLNVFVEPQTTLSAIVDHFQLLQLLRLSDDISKFADLLSTDQKFLSKGKTSDTPAPTVLLVAALAQAKVHLLLTHGPMPSPYEACPAINEAINTIDTNSYSGMSQKRR